MNKKRIIIIILSFLLLCFFVFSIAAFYFTSSVSSSNEEKNIVITPGMVSNDISKLLKENNLIKSEMAFKILLKLRKIDNIYAASYYMNESMNLNEIINVLEKGGKSNDDISLTFIEGINMESIIYEITKNTNNEKDDILKLLKDEKYLDYLIDKYWFLTNDIKNKGIYYSLEGYLFPDTYFFANKDVTVKEIFEVMLDKEEEVLNSYKDKINNNKYNIHKLITLASITQSEGVDSDDFKNIASVFLNRLENNIVLGSCVTSYYGVRKPMTKELYQKDIDDDNLYNTRGDNAKLIPIGPISNPSLKALDAVLIPIKTPYYYFVSDKNRKLYFTKTLDEHENMIIKLQNEGNWYEW